MRSRLKSAIFFVFSVLLASSYSSCDLINPDEQIPSFLRIDSISMATGNGEGNPDHNIVDAWVYENEKLLGIFELPAVIPILVDGEANIRIRGGIKLNGQVGTRIPYLFTRIQIVSYGMKLLLTVGRDFSMLDCVSDLPIK